MTGDTTKRWLADVQIADDSTIDSVSQPIGQIENFRRDTSGDVYEVTTGANWSIDGVPWTGAIATVGTGKDYSTLALAAAAATEDCLFLVDQGIYAIPSGGFAYDAYIRGLGATAEDTILVGGQYLSGNGNIFIENLWVYTQNAPGNGPSVLVSAATIFTANKSIIGNAQWLGSGSQEPISSGSSNTQNTILLSYTKIIPTYTAYYNAGDHIFQTDRACVSMTKVSWVKGQYLVWRDPTCVGTYAVDDKAEDGTAGYGPAYGDFRITNAPSGILTIYDTDRKELAGAAPAVVLALLGLDVDLLTFSLPASTTISAFGATLIDDADAPTALSTLGVHAAATVSSPLSITGQAIKLINNAGSPTDVTAIDVGALANSDTVVPTSKAVTTAIAGFSGGREPLTNGDVGSPEILFSAGDVLMVSV